MNHNIHAVVALVFMLSLPVLKASLNNVEQDLNGVAEKEKAVKVNKCCDKSDVKVDRGCVHNKHANTSVWVPDFKSENGQDSVQVPAFKFVVGLPACPTSQQLPIFHFKDSEDKLVLLQDGKLRHYINHEHAVSQDSMESMQIGLYGRIDPVSIPHDKKPLYYDYAPGQYCMDKSYMTKEDKTFIYAMVCVPEVVINWADTEFLMRKVLNPLFHGIAMLCLLVVAIIYFILPTLRDLTGNIVTTISICLILSQSAGMVRIFTEFSSHVSFMIADIVVYISTLAAFFWLNSFGFYIWKTFKSRNVFLRVTDGRKYCYYSCFAWGCTFTMAVLAIFAHFLLDIRSNPNPQIKTQFSSSLISSSDQDTIGWLGIAIFFTPVAFTIIINIFFYVTTLKVINRMNTYGRIHHKLKHSFIMFLQLFIIMSITWLFMMLSWLQYEGLFYCYVVINLLQGVLVLYVCVVRQKQVTFLLRKSCCYNEPVPTNDWGDEMTQMNGGNY